MPVHVSSTRAHRQETKTVVYSLWYHHTETSEWSKITKIQFYKYEHNSMHSIQSSLNLCTGRSPIG